MGLPDLGEILAADVRAACLGAGHEAFGGREDRNAESFDDLRNVRVDADIMAAARAC